MGDRPVSGARGEEGGRKGDKRETSGARSEEVRSRECVSHDLKVWTRDRSRPPIYVRNRRERGKLWISALVIASRLSIYLVMSTRGRDRTLFISRCGHARVYIRYFTLAECIAILTVPRIHGDAFLQKFAAAVNISKAVDINCAAIRRYPESLRGCAKE